MYDSIATISAHFHLTWSQYVAVYLYKRSFHSVGKSILCNLPIITVTSQSPIPHLYLNYQTNTHILRSVTKQEGSFPVSFLSIRKDYTFFLLNTSPKPSYPPPKNIVIESHRRKECFSDFIDHCSFTLPQTGSLLKSP